MIIGSDDNHGDVMRKPTGEWVVMRDFPQGEEIKLPLECAQWIVDKLGPGFFNASMNWRAVSAGCRAYQPMILESFIVTDD